MYTLHSKAVLHPSVIRCLDNVPGLVSLESWIYFRWCSMIENFNRPVPELVDVVTGPRTGQSVDQTMDEIYLYTRFYRMAYRGP